MLENAIDLLQFTNNGRVVLMSVRGGESRLLAVYALFAIASPRTGFLNLGDAHPKAMRAFNSSLRVS
jgi:hypothetical protein